MKVLLWLLLLPINLIGQNLTRQEFVSWGLQAKQVTIVRDNWGVPHIYGKTDADCIFGLAFAQAEDNFEHIVDNYIQSIGRGAEVRGNHFFNNDYLVHAFQLPEKAQADYNAATPEMKKLYDAFAAGLNYYIALKKPSMKLIDRIEPWYPLAMLLHKYYILEFIEDAGVDMNNLKIDTTERSEQSTGSNQWAINGSKCKNAKSMLFINPHVSFFGFGTFTEAHIESEEGWSFSGVTRTGFLLPYMGHNQYLGWGFTDNYADKGDLYAERFDKKGSDLEYKYGSSYRKASSWEKSIFIRSGNSLMEKKVKFRKTHHGPIITKHNGQPIAVKLAKYDETCTWYDQYYAMTKAKSLATFKNALEMLALPYMNIAYADNTGNIFYIYTSLVPVRNKIFNWRLPVDGSNPDTEWKGYHLISELPQVLNPKDNFVQNCNSSPFTTTISNNPVKEDFPGYMIGNEFNNARSRRSKEILAGTYNIDFAQWQKLVTDQKVWLADSILKLVTQEFTKLEKSSKDSANVIRPLLTELLSWNQVSDVQSVAMTLFDKTLGYYPREKKFIKALFRTKFALEENWGTWKVPYGDVSRLQRVHWNLEEGFNDQKQSWPAPGGRSSYGTIFCFNTSKQLRNVPSPVNKRSYGVSGNSYVSVVEFNNNTVKALSILPFGQSGDPQSKHYTDQSELYTKGIFKDAWYYKKDVLENATKTYHPGQ